MEIISTTNITKHVKKFRIKITLAIFCCILLSLSCTDFIADINPQNEWNVIETDKIVLHYRPQNYSSAPSPTGNEANDILLNQVFYYQSIKDSIQREFDDKILIYLFNRDEAKSLIGTNGGGHSLPKYNTYYYTFITGLPEYRDQYGKVNPFVGAHELAHIISHRTLGYPGTKLMSEGYAVWLDGGYARNLIDDIIRSYKRKAPNKILTPDQLLLETVNNESIYYPNCGVFIRFLVHTYGIEISNKLFTSQKENFKYDFSKYTGKNWNEMCEQYARYVENI